MATKFDRPDAWAALEAEDHAYWAARTLTQRSESVISLSRELLAIQRQNASAALVADRLRREEKLRGWVALKEHLGCPSVNRQSSKKSSGAR